MTPDQTTRQRVDHMPPEAVGLVAESLTDDADIQLLI